MAQERAANRQETIRLIIIGVFVLILLINAYSYKRNEEAEANRLVVKRFG